MTTYVLIIYTIFTGHRLGSYSVTMHEFPSLEQCVKFGNFIIKDSGYKRHLGYHGNVQHRTICAKK